ncbi:MCE family protein [Mycobacterium sp. 852002-51971_SCH5477799-a]|uniref:MCE family protein n=1 Tax=Mycobacterium sp. 852002-51971_SCH5477799-a TaxID=1834106 RepID=UPI000A48D65B|nr:MCE family protein [Mycobacterium sp. 852002-51971_SCH5477799-a]
MMPLRTLHRLAASLLAVVTVSGCAWHGLNSLPLPGTAGGGPGSFEIKAQIPDITNIEPNSRVRVGDVTVGNVTNVAIQGWHALVTMRIDGDVDLPANATAKVGQTSLLGSLHIELAPPTHATPQGKLTNGAVIPLSRAGSYPTTEQTLSSLSLLLNGGGLGQLQDINEALTTAYANGRDADMRQLFEQLDRFTANLNDQTGDIIRASESINGLANQYAKQKPVIDNALRTIPGAFKVLADERDKLVETLDKTGKLADLANATIGPTKDALVRQLQDIGPVLESLANAGPSLTRSLVQLGAYPFNIYKVPKTLRGDYANLSVILDLTLNRIDTSLLTGTRFEGNLTELEMQWGRTIGQIPAPYTSGNPLVVPYHLNQGS